MWKLRVHRRVKMWHTYRDVITSTLSMLIAVQSHFVGIESSYYVRFCITSFRWRIFLGYFLLFEAQPWAGMAEVVISHYIAQCIPTTWRHQHWTHYLWLTGCAVIIPMFYFFAVITPVHSFSWWHTVFFQWLGFVFHIFSRFLNVPSLVTDDFAPCVYCTDECLIVLLTCHMTVCNVS